MKLNSRSPIFVLLLISISLALLSNLISFSVLSNLRSPSMLKSRIDTRHGGWWPIENLNSEEVLKMAKYAVTERNNRTKSASELVAVIGGESQVVAGMNYRLVISVKEGGGKKNKYEAVVWDQPWMKFRQLTSFEEVKGYCCNYRVTMDCGWVEKFLCS